MTSITHRPNPRAISAILVVAAALLGGLVLSGCGASKGAAPSSTTTATPTTPTTTTPNGTTPSAPAGFEEYRSCLESHGVTLPQGGFGGGNGGGGAAPPNGGGNGGGGAPPNGRPSLSDAQQQAFDDCASLQPSGGFGGGGGGGPNSDNPASAEFQACLKEHGVDTTSPNSRDSSEFQAALSACRDLLPNGGTGGGPGFGNGGPPGGANGQGNGGFAQLQSCLREHGVDPSAPGSQSGAETQAAIEACRQQLPGAGAGNSPPSTTTSG